MVAATGAQVRAGIRARVEAEAGYRDWCRSRAWGKSRTQGQGRRDRSRGRGRIAVHNGSSHSKHGFWYLISVLPDSKMASLPNIMSSTSEETSLAENSALWNMAACGVRGGVGTRHRGGGGGGRTQSSRTHVAAGHWGGLCRAEEGGLSGLKPPVEPHSPLPKPWEKLMFDTWTKQWICRKIGWNKIVPSEEGGGFGRVNPPPPWGPAPGPLPSHCPLKTAKMTENEKTSTVQK